MVSLVRPAEVEDAAAIAAVHVATWRTTYRGLLPDDFLDSLDESGYEERWRRILVEPSSRVYVAADGPQVVGFASGGRERAGEDGFSGELYAIYVVQEAQGRGHGRRLVQAVVGGLRELGLEDMIVWVLRDNAGERHRRGDPPLRPRPDRIQPGRRGAGARLPVLRVPAPGRDG